MTIVGMKKLVGDFAENKDLAKDIRINKLLPLLEKERLLLLILKEFLVLLNHLCMLWLVMLYENISIRYMTTFFSRMPTKIYRK